MSIRRIQRADMLNGISSTSNLARANRLYAVHRSISSPTFSDHQRSVREIPTVYALTRSLSGATLVNAEGSLSGEEKSGSSSKGITTGFTNLPTELHLCIADHLVLADLLVLRRVNRSLVRLADSKLAAKTAIRLAVAREVALADSTTRSETEERNIRLMRFNHAYLCSVSHLDIEELRWSRNPAPEIRMICQALVALHRGHFSDVNYLDTAACKREPWSSIRAALGTPEFRRWIASLRKSANRISDSSEMREFYQELEEEDLHPSGQLLATNIWRTLGTTFERMTEVSAVGHRVLLFVSAAVQYIELRNGLRLARDTAQESAAKLRNWEIFLSCLRT